MPPTTRKRAASIAHNAEFASTSPSNPIKKLKVGEHSTNNEQREIDEVDLRDMDDDDGLTNILEKQRIATVKAQQEQADKPVTFSTLQCIICMESMTNVTATHCGKNLAGREDSPFWSS